MPITDSQIVHIVQCGWRIEGVYSNREDAEQRVSDLNAKLIQDGGIAYVYFTNEYVVQPELNY